MESLNAAQSALRALGGMLEARLEMFSLEATIEKRKAVLLLSAVLLAAGFTLMTSTFAGVFLILLAAEANRVYVACGWMLLNALMAVICMGVVLFSLRKGAAPFAHTREELRKDIACLGIVVKSGE
ncbi:phage holin family protein [Coraliomargarita sp. W4R72]